MALRCTWPRLLAGLARADVPAVVLPSTCRVPPAYLRCTWAAGRGGDVPWPVPGEQRDGRRAIRERSAVRSLLTAEGAPATCAGPRHGTPAILIGVPGARRRARRASRRPGPRKSTGGTPQVYDRYMAHGKGRLGIRQFTHDIALGRLNSRVSVLNRGAADPAPAL